MTKNRKTEYRFKFLVISMVVFFMGCAQEEPIPEPKKVIRPVKTKTIIIDPKGMEDKQFSGVAQSDETAILSFRVSGVLQKMNVEVGDRVKKGEVIAVLDKRDYRLKQKDLKGQLTTAQANLDQILKGARREDIRILENKIASMESSVKTARQEYQRVQQLYANDAASKGRLDQAKNGLDKALLDLKSATEEYVIATHGGREEEVRAQKFKVESIASNLELAQANLKDTELLAPFDGEISEKHLSNFEQVTSGQKIYTLVNLNRIEISISVPEEWVSKISKKQKAKINFLKYPDKSFEGRVDRIGVVADPETLTYPVIVILPNNGTTFLPGMSAKVTLKIKGRGGKLPTVPIHAVMENSATGQKFVWTVNTQTETVHRTQVDIGNISNNEIKIKEGLNHQDLVVVAGTNLLKEGMKVRIR